MIRIPYIDDCSFLVVNHDDYYFDCCSIFEDPPHYPLYWLFFFVSLKKKKKWKTQHKKNIKQPKTQKHAWKNLSPRNSPLGSPISIWWTTCLAMSVFISPTRQELSVTLALTKWLELWTPINQHIMFFCKKNSTVVANDVSGGGNLERLLYRWVVSVVVDPNPFSQNNQNYFWTKSYQCFCFYKYIPQSLKH